MLVVVNTVSALVHIYSLGYMSHDENFTRFFCFLSLFAAAMLGLIIANNLLPDQERVRIDVFLKDNLP